MAKAFEGKAVLEKCEHAISQISGPQETIPDETETALSPGRR